MTQRRGWFWIMGGAILAVVAGVLVFTMMQRTVPASGAPAPQAEGPQVRVVVAARDIPRQTVIRDADLAVEERPADAVPDDAMLGGIQGVVGKIAHRSIAKREIVVGDMLTTYIPGSGDKVAFATLGGPDEMLLAREDQVLMAVLPLDLLSTQFLAVGSRVDLLVSLIKAEAEEETSTSRAQEGTAPSEDGSSDRESGGSTETDARPAELITFYTIQNAEVVAIKYTSGEIVKVDIPTLTIGQNQNKDSSKEGIPVPQALLIALDPQDALILKHVLDRTDTIINAVLRAPSNDQLFDTQPVDREYLYDRYTLPR